MPGMLATIREDWAAFLRSDAASGAATFFGTAPAIPIHTEKLKTIDQVVTDAIKKIGLNVVIVTVTARDAQNQARGLRFKNIIAAARIYENPKVNQTGVSASDCAEAVAHFTRKFTTFGAPMQFLEISLGNDPRALTYDVLYRVEAESAAVPARGSGIAVTDDNGNRLTDDDATRITDDLA